jgi:tetratricopeptide (TPR) repeat protein
VAVLRWSSCRRLLIEGGRAILFGVILALALPVFASTESSESLIKEGVALRRRGDDAGAVRVLRRAYALERNARTAGQLALAEMALGLWVDAEAHLIEALGHTQHPWIQENKKALAEALDGVRSYLGRVFVVGRPPGAQVEVAGRAAGTLPLEAPVRAAAGEVEIRVSSPGHSVHRRTVMVKAEETTHVTVELESSVASNTAGSVAEEPTAAEQYDGDQADHEPTNGGGARLRVIGISLAGVGLAATVAGLLVRSSGATKRTAIEQASASGMPYDPAHGNWRSLERTGTLLLLSGAAVTLVGGGLAAWGWSGTGSGAKSDAVSLSLMPGRSSLLGFARCSF